MKRVVLSLGEIGERQRRLAGGKARALAAMLTAGMAVPQGACVLTTAYDSYVEATGLRERIMLELSRKPFSEMRWEELWDAALRIRHMFDTTPMPRPLERTLGRYFDGRFGDTPVVVRSSAPGEDAAASSFAGLHESYVNVRGAEAILEHVRLVWASLWSDRALLYRQELNLDVSRSAMAVVVQEIVAGQRSGVAFCRNPADDSQAVIEAVHGLNQGLVDGTVEPDSWVIARQSGAIVSHRTADRRLYARAAAEGVRLEPLPPDIASTSPLQDHEVNVVYKLAQQAERLFGPPQDVEWTYRDDTLYVLQSRPITTTAEMQGDDKRPWYLSLRRSYANLVELRRIIEGERLPQMAAEADQWAQKDLAALSDADLAAQITDREQRRQEWIAVYYREFIPFAHGARLFGQYYNDTVHPTDPFEFVRLLSGGDLAGLRRNRLLSDLAGRLAADPELFESVRSGTYAGGRPEFDELLAGFVTQFAGVGLDPSGRDLLPLLLDLAIRSPGHEQQSSEAADLRFSFLERLQGQKREEAESLHELARASYRLRDDDNIYLGRIEAQADRASAEGRRRLATRLGLDVSAWRPQDLAVALLDRNHRPSAAPVADMREIQTEPGLKPRQLVGQPAGPGLGRGPARVVQGLPDLLAFKSGEVLVCDALDPTMTFVVPLAAAIVERRGGMLIHGAIIAREYGLPCVTGVSAVTELVHTGDALTVDGYLGIVVIG